jgi:hypothetical protein
MAIQIVKGASKTIRVNLTDKETGKPFSLTGFAGTTAYFQKVDETVLGVTGSLVSADCGELEFDLLPADTNQLAAAENTDFEVEVLKGSETIIAQILGKISISERLFS